jgi:hypothetical protein
LSEGLEKDAPRMIKKCLLLFCLVLFLTGLALGSAAFKLQVTSEQANIREKPDIASAILLQVPEGTLLEAERKEGEWYAVRVEQEGGGPLFGYVHESLVKPVAPPEEKTEIKQVPEEQTSIPSQLEAKPLASKPKAERFSVSLWLGRRYASMADLNEGAKGLAQVYEYMLGARGEGEVDPLHLGYLFGVEVQIPLDSQFFFSIGAEYYSGENSSSVSYDKGSSRDLYTTKPGVRAIPVSLSLSYYVLPYVYAKAGLDYTFARCAYFYRFQKPDSWQEWEGQASSGGLGYQISLGADWKFLSHVSFVAELSYRHLQISELEGENFYRESDGYNSHEEGKLYIFHITTNGKDLVPLVFVRAKKPSEAGVYDYQDAELSLSGLSLRAGIRIRF